MQRTELTVWYECDKCDAKQEPQTIEFIGLYEFQEAMSNHRQKTFGEDGWVHWRRKDRCPNCNSDLR